MDSEDTSVSDDRQLQVSRRQFLKLVGITAGAGAATSVGLNRFQWNNTLSRITGQAVNPSDADIIVSPNGGTSIQQAIDNASAGDTILLRGGTYNVNSAINIRSSGSSGNRIILAGHPDEESVIKFSGSASGGWNSYNQGGIQISGAYWTIQGLTVRDSPYMGIVMTRNGAHHNRIVNVESAHNNLPGIACHSGAENNVIEGCIAHDNYDPQSGGEDADGIQCSESDNNTIRNCSSYKNSDDGFDLWESKNCTIERCIAYGNGAQGGNGNGFKLGGSGSGISSGGHMIVQNLAYNNPANGFDYNTANIAMEVYNNTSFNNGMDYVFGGSAAHVLKNNIAGDNNNRLNSNVKHDHNTWNLNISSPQFKSTDPESSDFMYLATGSPCIDAGTDVGIGYSGDSPDLGAYEHGMEQTGPGRDSSGSSATPSENSDSPC